MKKTIPIILFFLACGGLLSACSDIENVNSMIDKRLSQETAQQPAVSDLENTAANTEEALTSEPAPLQKGKIIPILMFHYVRDVAKTKDPEGYDLSIDPKHFEQMLQYLSTNGYHTIHVSDLLTGPVPDKSIILTFDDGHEDFYTTARPLLEKYGFTASEAIITGKMDGVQFMTPAQVKEISREGFEILSHTVNHVDLNAVPYQKAELVDSKTYLEKLLGKSVDTIVYPAGRYNNETLKLARAAGYTIGLTTRPGYAELNKDLLQLQRIRIDNRTSYLEFIKELSPAP
jgi:peptidoglycan/xylan/chitin deacetylase (PgdA/CDA1 family)